MSQANAFAHPADLSVPSAAAEVLNHSGIQHKRTRLQTYGKVEKRFTRVVQEEWAHARPDASETDRKGPRGAARDVHPTAGCALTA